MSRVSPPGSVLYLEFPPAGTDEKWWADMTREAAEIYNHYQTPMARHILYGVIDGHSEQYRLNMINAMERSAPIEQQLRMDGTT